MGPERLVGATWSCSELDVVSALAALRSAGFATVEMWAQGAHLDPRVSPDLRAIRDALTRNRLSISSVHLPFVLEGQAQPATRLTTMWQRLCSDTLDLAGALDARLAVAHPVLFLDADDGIDVAVDRFVGSFAALGDKARARGIQLALENMHTLRGPTLRSVAETRQAVWRSAGEAGICLDLGHAIFNGYTGQGLVNEILGAGEDLVHTHIHDSDGVGRDPHLAPGQGIAAWPEVIAAFREVGYSGRHVLEVAGGAEPVQMLARAREQFLRLLDPALDQ